MKLLHNISPYSISWIKSNKDAFEKEGNVIKNLYYPETQRELIDLLREMYSSGKDFSVIGCSSNTLFLPSYSAENVVCTTELNTWVETDDTIVCECGVNVPVLSRRMVEKGVVGFEGMTDLPGTIASGVYGNCGCRGCSVLSLLQEFKLMSEDGEIRTLHTQDLKAEYRSTSLKRGELKGVIIEVVLRKTSGDADDLKKKAAENHEYRRTHQPSAANNLGTTFNGGNVRTAKGCLYGFIEKLIAVTSPSKSARAKNAKLLKLVGQSKFIPYVYCWNRYMFLDAESHMIFQEYFDFLKSLYKDVRLEIEIKG